MRQMERQTHMGDRQKDTDIKIDRWKDSQTERETDGETDKQKNRQKGRKTDR